MGVVLLFLSLQLFGMSYHGHAYLDASTPCASCDFDHYLPPVLPQTTVAAVPAATGVSYLAPTWLTYQSISRLSYLIPLALAPPR